MVHCKYSDNSFCFHILEDVRVWGNASILKKEYTRRIIKDMKMMKKLFETKWITGINARSERKFFFIMTIIMIIWGLLYKMGVMQG